MAIDGAASELVELRNRADAAPLQEFLFDVVALRMLAEGAFLRLCRKRPREGFWRLFWNLSELFVQPVFIAPRSKTDTYGALPA